MQIYSIPKMHVKFCNLLFIYFQNDRSRMIYEMQKAWGNFSVCLVGEMVHIYWIGIPPSNTQYQSVSINATVGTFDIDQLDSNSSQINI